MNDQKIEWSSLSLAGHAKLRQQEKRKRMGKAIWHELMEENENESEKSEIRRSNGRIKKHIKNNRQLDSNSQSGEVERNNFVDKKRMVEENGVEEDDSSNDISRTQKKGLNVFNSTQSTPTVRPKRSIKKTQTIIESDDSEEETQQEIQSVCSKK
jgi:hypothetical protein